jgi:SpoVK/Ycf46/Vps4 family AAA+-type ATPase
MDNPLIESLRRALRQNPDNVPLQLSLARALLESHDYIEAENEYKKGLAKAPDDVDMKTGLAETFYAQGKISAALVICEELTAKEQGSAHTYLLHARTLQQREEYAKAAEMYKKARELDGNIRDDCLESLPARRSEKPFEEPEPSFEYTDGDPDGRFVPYRERPGLSFADVGGMDDLKEEIRLKIIHPMTNPEIYAAYGKKIGGGILMYGPPGCGKTHLARATAGEVNAAFISVSISDVLDVYTGQSERNLRDLFESARSSRPSVLFFDEVDALGASRRDMRQSASRQVINQFLAELDGMDGDNDGVLILAATNAPWHLDGAFRRPGRFDRIIFVPPPDEPARDAILSVLLKGKPAGDVDIPALAKRTGDFSGADIKALIDLAIEDKLRDALKTGKPEPLTTKGLAKTVRKIKPSTRGWFVTAKNHALYANENGLYDDILSYLRIK